ncbi:unnamed protein product [Urochloa humidicola]
MSSYTLSFTTARDSKTSMQVLWSIIASSKCSACSASMLKDLGILGKDGKLNEKVIQDYADRLKELLPPEDLKPLMVLKGRAFLELLVELSLSLC